MKYNVQLNNKYDTNGIISLTSNIIYRVIGYCKFVKYYIYLLVKLEMIAMGMVYVDLRWWLNYPEMNILCREMLLDVVMENDSEEGN